MRGLAELAMRSPKMAVVMSAMLGCFPVLFWLSAAIVSLVVLRKGVNQGLKILTWALLPSLAWAVQGQYNIALGMLTTTLLACILRVTGSWQKTLLALLPAGIIIALFFEKFAPEQVGQLSVVAMELLTKILKQAGKTQLDFGGNLSLLVHYSVVSLLSWINLVGCVFGLMLARYWQSWLYNPGGFREEFHNIRISAVIGLILLAMVLLGAILAPFTVIVVPIASLPLFIAGISLIHWLITLRGLGNAWVVVFYAVVVVFTQFAYPIIVLLACLDGFFDYRKRLITK